MARFDAEFGLQAAALAFTLACGSTAALAQDNSRPLEWVVGYAAGGSDTKNAVVPVAGLGVSYALNKQWSINGDWDHIRSKFSSQEKASTNLFTVGASYRF